MNPLTELKALTDLFASDPPLIDHAEHVPAAGMPECYREMLAHDSHMTVTMERYHQDSVDVRIIERLQDGDIYSRKILLLKSGTETVVQFGIVRFDLSYVTEAVRSEIIEGKTPLGRVLINHNVLRHIDLGALLRVQIGEPLARYFQVDAGRTTYGRLATIFCDENPAVDLLEISAPLEENGNQSPTT